MAYRNLRNLARLLICLNINDSAILYNKYNSSVEFLRACLTYHDFDTNFKQAHSFTGELSKVEDQNYY